MLTETEYEHQSIESTHWLRNVKRREKSEVFSNARELLHAKTEFQQEQRKTADQRRENSMLTYGKVFIFIAHIRDVFCHNNCHIVFHV